MACVPGAFIQCDELLRGTVASNIQMTGNSEVGDFGKKRVRGGIQAILKKGFHGITTEYAGWQADVMDYQ